MVAGYNETTALRPPNEALLGVTDNSMGTTTNTGTPALSAQWEYQPGSREPPPNVLAPLRPAPVTQRLPAPAVPRVTASTVPPGHSLTGNLGGMAGAVDAAASIPLDPYIAILGTPGKNRER